MIKDYTHEILPILTQELTILITFVLNRPGGNKLMLVKLIKSITTWGLKQSKDFVDAANNQPVMFRKHMTLPELDNFRTELNNTDADYTLDDRQRIRNKKLLDLGIGDKFDLVDELSTLDVEKILMNGYSSTKLKDILYEIYNHIDDEKLKEIYINYNHASKS